MDGSVGDGEGGGRLERSSLLRFKLVRAPSADSNPRRVPRRCRVDFREPSSAVWDAMDVSSSWSEVVDGSGLISRFVDFGLPGASSSV